MPGEQQLFQAIKAIRNSSPDDDVAQFFASLLFPSKLSKLCYVSSL
jgi:hypothetical protein